ncbi:hypothetical protein BUE80_DR005965 [Diplocarpon rosae]|nr:hypothetical protein BUE80_DR005965 [Diplocarpon rosae]
MSCRTLKIKCDGNDQCTTGIKKGIECKYRPEHQVVNEQRQTKSPNGGPPESMDIDQSSMSKIFTDLHQEPARRRAPGTFNLTKPIALSDWSAVKIVRDQPSNENVPRPDPAFARYIGACFTHFHYHWKLIQRPNF